MVKVYWQNERKVCQKRNLIDWERKMLPLVVVIYGGQSMEHEISCRSASFIIKNINLEKWNVIPVFIDKKGSWWPQDLNKYLKDVSIVAKTQHKIESHNTSERPMNIREAVLNLSGIAQGCQQPIVYFPIVHGTYGEDGCLQGLLDLAGLPYVGSGLLSSAISMDKVITKQLVEQVGIKVADYMYFNSAQWEQSAEDVIKQSSSKLGFPLFVKPSSQGSSVGISKAHDESSLRTACQYALKYGDKILIEKSIEPIREIECAILGSKSFECTTPGEIQTVSGFYSYDSKYKDLNDAKLKIPADIDENTAKDVKNATRKICHILNIEGMARVDFFFNNLTNELIFNEVNTLPGFTSISQYPALWAYEGVSGSMLVDRLLEQALLRGSRKNL